MIPRPTGLAEGPYDAAFLPRLLMSFRAAPAPVTEPVTKFGGQPVWLEEPAWPVRPGTGEPLVFIAQFRVPGDEVRLAYLFLEEDGWVMGGAGPLDDDAAVIVQPGGRVPPFARIGPPGTRGRTLWRWGPDESEIPVEYLVDLLPVPPGLERAAEEHAAWTRYLRDGGPEVDVPEEPGPDDFLGGTARYTHTRAQVGAPWRFLCQFADRGEAEDDPFFLNFGYGTGLVFLSPDGLEGRFCSESS